MVDCSSISGNSNEQSIVEATYIQEMIQGDGKEMSSSVGKEGHVENRLTYIVPVIVTGNNSVEEYGVMMQKSEKCSKRNVTEEVPEMTVDLNHYQTVKNVSKRSYSRNEIESLSCLNVEEQKIMWNEIYEKMGPSLAREYEAIAASKPKKQGGSGKKIDHDQHITKKKDNGPIHCAPKKKGNESIHGLMPTDRG